MAKYNTVKDLFSAICDAVRSKTDTTDLIKHEDIPEKISSIQGSEPPEVDVSYMYFLKRSDNSITADDKIKELEQDIKNHPNKVFDLRYMFNSTNNLYTYLNFKNIKNVINASFLFSSQNKLTDLDLTTFDTSNTIDMSYMFYRCSRLTNLDVSKFNTSNVIDMSYMFTECSAVTNLDVSEFNTSNVINMSYMFNKCDKITNLDVEDWDVSNVEDISYIFSATDLTSLDLSKWNTPKLNNVNNMFTGCDKLTNLKLSKNFSPNSSSISLFNSYTNQLLNIDMDGNTNFSRHSSTSTFNLATMWRGNTEEYIQKYVNFANSLGVCSSTKTRNIKIYTNLYNALTAEQKALITDKGYNLSYGTS